MSLLVLGGRKGGKTSIVNLIAGNEIQGDPPATETINWESFQVNGQHFRSLEIGGLAETGQRWQDIVKPPQGVILVVDGAGRSQIKEAQQYFDQILTEDKLRGVPVLVFANKSDIQIYNDELIDELQIMEVSDREIFVQASCALNGEGIAEGLEKLIQNIQTPEQRGSGYSFEAQPQVVKNKGKYKNEGDIQEFAQKSQQTFVRLMQDKEIKQMHPTHQESEYIRREKDRIQLENMHNQLQNFKTNKQKMTPYDIKPSPNPQIDVNLEFFLTDNKNTIAPEEKNTDIQTDDFLKPPPSPKYIPKQTGIDKYTQVQDNQLFDFDRQVTPIIDVIVTQTLEESLLEIEQERELEQMKEFKNQFNDRRNKDKIHQKKVLDEQFHVIQQKKDLKSKFQKKESKIKETLRVTQAYGIAKTFLRFIKPNSFDFLYKNGLYQNNLENTTASVFMDWLVDEVVKELDIKKAISNSMEGMYDVATLPPLTVQAQPTWDIINQKQVIHETRRTNWSENKRFVRFFYQSEHINPSLFFQHFPQFIDNSIEEYEKAYKNQLDSLQAQIDSVEIQPQDKQRLLEAEFPPVTANYFSSNITKVKRIAFTLAHDCFYLTDPKDRNLELQCAILDKEGNVFARVNRQARTLPGQNQSVKYKQNIRDKKVRVCQDECILITHDALPEQAQVLLLFTRVRNIQAYATNVQKNPDFNKNARYGLVDFEHGIQVDHTNLVPTHKFEELVKPQESEGAALEQSSLVLSYVLLRQHNNNWKFQSIQVPSKGLFATDIDDYLSQVGNFFFHVMNKSAFVSDRGGDGSAGGGGGAGGQENQGENHNAPAGLVSRVYNVIQVDLRQTVEEVETLFREKLEAEDPELIASCPDGYEIQIRGQALTRTTKLQKTQNAFELTIFRVPPPPPEKEEEAPQEGAEGGNEEGGENPPEQ